MLWAGIGHHQGVGLDERFVFLHFLMLIFVSLCRGSRDFGMASRHAVMSPAETVGGNN